MALNILTTQDRVISVLNKVLGTSGFVIQLDQNFYKDFGINSLDMIVIAMAMEDEFDCSVPENDVNKWSTPNDIIEFFNNKKSMSSLSSTIISELCDYHGSLGELNKIVESLVKKHGEDAMIEFDAGYNNIIVNVTK